MHERAMLAQMVTLSLLHPWIVIRSWFLLESEVGSISVFLWIMASAMTISLAPEIYFDRAVLPLPICFFKENLSDLALPEQMWRIRSGEYWTGAGCLHQEVSNGFIISSLFHLSKYAKADEDIALANARESPISKTRMLLATNLHFLLCTVFSNSAYLCWF